MSLLFVNIGWMINYHGPAPEDPTLGGFGFLKNHKVGHESWNFAPIEGRIYGYIPRSAKVNLKRLGGNSKDESIENVTIVWMARNPRNKILYIVGWYLFATVNKSHVSINRDSKNVVEYQVYTKVGNSRLLDLGQRLFAMPTRNEPNHPGQSPIWYGGTDGFRQSVLDYISVDGVIQTPVKKGNKGRHIDPEKRKLIEVEAVKHATKYFNSPEGGSRTVSSVEKDNVGWDLNVEAPTGEVLKVEVKGLSGSEVVVELTPNEYTQMRSKKHRSQYVVYVVTQADSSNAKSHVFYFNAEASKAKNLVWTTEAKKKLEIKERLGARLTCK